MSIDIKIKDGKGAGNKASVDKYNSIAVHETIPELPPTGTDNRRIYYKETVENMDVNGSSTPVVFSVNADTFADIYISRILILIEDAKVKPEKYGDINALSNGVDLIVYEGTSITSIVDSAINITDLTVQTGGFPSELKVKTSGAELAIILFDASAIIPNGIRLGRGTTDRVEFIVNDNLTGLDDHSMVIIGYKHVD
jgi:hypothetical protein